ncbi:MAG: TIGR03943 family protein [Pseudomonadota bacterium]
MDGNLKSSSMSRFMLLIVLIAWIAAFWILIQRIEGTPLISKLLRQDYWWLVDVGTGILLLFLLSLVYLDPHCAGPHGIRLTLQVGIMILPLLYVPTAVTSRLSPDALNKRLSLAQQNFRMAQPGVFSVSGAGYSNSDPKNRDLSLPDDPSVLRLALWPEPYDGKLIKTLGMVYKNDNLPPNSFYCCQLVMYCCAADASPLGVLVEYDGVNDLTNGQWVKVEGKVKISRGGDRQKTEIVAEKVEPIEPPKDQYLYP